MSKNWDNLVIWNIFVPVFKKRFPDAYPDDDHVITSDTAGLTFFADDLPEFLDEAQASAIIDKEIASIKAEDDRIAAAVAKIEWKQGLLYDALHRVGDDPTKSAIEDDLAEQFKDQPEVLNKIIQIFSLYTKDWEE